MKLKRRWIKSFRFFSSASLPCFGPTVTHSCAPPCAFVATILTRLQIHSFLGVVIASLHISLKLAPVRYQSVWISSLQIRPQIVVLDEVLRTGEGKPYRGQVSSPGRVNASPSRIEGVPGSQLATKWSVGLFEEETILWAQYWSLFLAGQTCRGSNSQIGFSKQKSMLLGPHISTSLTTVTSPFMPFWSG